MRPPAGDAGPGRLLVARSVPREEGRYALLGRGPVVDLDAEGDFESLLQRLPGAGPEKDRRLFRAHGGRILAAAWSWPVVRRVTFEGEVVASGSASFELGDLEAAIDALQRAPGFARIDPEQRDEPEVAAWHWLAPSGGSPAAVAGEPGMRSVICEEDAAGPRRLALVEVDPDDGRLWVFAPTPARLGRAERELQRLLGDLVGELCHRDCDPPDVERRWERERWERRLARFPRPGQHSRSLPRAA